MYIDPALYTELVEEIRTLKALNEVLIYENKNYFEQFID